MRQNEAREALALAQEVESRARSGGGWYMGFGIAFGVASFLLTLTIGLYPAPWAMGLAMGLFGVFLTALITWAVTRAVVPRGFGWLHGAGMGVWGLVYGLVLALGIRYFPQDPSWWVPGAVVTALPLLVTGYLALRRGRSSS